MLLPSKYIPKVPAEFCGPAQKVAIRQARFMDNSKKTGDSLAFLLTGPPGTGKTSLGRYVGLTLGVPGTLLDPMNGTQLTIDRVNEIAERLHYRPMFGDWHFIFVDEFDYVPAAAKVRLLTVLNELPRWTAFIATCNRTTDALGQRNQSRFNAFEVNSPSAAEIESFLVNRYAIPAPLAQKAIACATSKDGLFDVIDMRQVLKDCDEIVLMAGESADPGRAIGPAPLAPRCPDLMAFPVAA